MTSSFSSSLPSTGGELTTDRLVLRPWSAEVIGAVLGGDRLAHWAEDFPAEGDRVIAGVIAAERDASNASDASGGPGQDGHRLIVERESGRTVGSISLLLPPTDGALEIGYGVVASRRGRGLASEAARALVEFALASDDVHTVYADVELSNPASVRVSEKAGLRRWSEDATTARFGVTDSGSDSGSAPASTSGSSGA